MEKERTRRGGGVRDEDDVPEPEAEEHPVERRGQWTAQANQLPIALFAAKGTHRSTKEKSTVITTLNARMSFLRSWQLP